MKLFGKQIGRKKQDIENVEVQPVIIMEETVSVSHKVNKQRVNPGLKFEGIDFFYSKKILYPANQDPEMVEKIRQEARDTCWQQIHELELDFVRSEGIGAGSYETQWEKILGAREREAEEEALRQAELEADREYREQEQRDDEEAKTRLGIDDIPDDVKDEILAEAFPEVYKPDPMPASLEVRAKKEKELKTRTLAKGRFEETGNFGDIL